MRASWAALHSRLTRSTETHRFQIAFEAMCSRMSILGRFRDPPALFDALHARDGDPHERNDILRTLVAAAQEAEPEPAATLLLLALWPGLDAVRGRLWPFYRRDPEALVSELTGRVLDNIHRLDLTSVTWIAATLIRNAERDIRRSLQSERAFVALPDGHDLTTSNRHSPLGIPAGLDADAAAIVIARRLRPILGLDATLVTSVAVEGARQHEAAAELGCSPEAARKRYQRALQRLREDFEAAA